MIARRNFIKTSTFATGALLVAKPSTAAAASPYDLAALPYSLDALEPHIDAKTMEIHHGRHHAAYINNLNNALEGKDSLLALKLPELLATLPSVEDEALRTTIRNNGGGHWNHDFFWNTICPAEKSGKPSDDLSAAINAEFGSIEKMKDAFAAAAGSRFGSGWAWIIAKDGKLKITSTPNQDAPMMKGLVPDTELGTPLLGLDVWEHAYYLHYQNRRADYVTASWNIINWKAVSARL